MPVIVLLYAKELLLAFFLIKAFVLELLLYKVSKVFVIYSYRLENSNSRYKF